MITSRAVLFGFIGGCFYLIAIVNSLPPLFYALMWLTAGILVSCFGISLLSLYGLRASWQLEAGSVAQAAPVEGLEPPRDEDSEEMGRDSGLDLESPEAVGAGITLEIGNAGTFGKSDIVIEVVLRSLVRASREPSEQQTRRGEEKIVRRFLLEALPSRALLLTTLPLHDLERGRYCVEVVRAIGSDVLGLFRPRRVLVSSSVAAGVAAEVAGKGESECGASEVVVGPRLVRGIAGHSAGAVGAAGNGGVTAVAGRSDEFGGTRPYVAGDDLRFVHWKSTARRGEMVVREWERAVQNRSVVFWDGAALLVESKKPSKGAASSPAQSLAQSPALHLAGAEWHTGEAARAWRRSVEWSLEVALSLSGALAENGDPCTLWRIDGTPASSEIASSAPPTRAAQMLADAQAARTTPLHEALGLALASRGRQARESGGRAFVIAPVPSPSLRFLSTRLPHASLTVGLVDASRFESSLNRAAPGAWRAWHELMNETEKSLRQVGVRVVRLPVEVAGVPLPSLERFHSDAAARDALRSLIEGRSAST